MKKNAPEHLGPDGTAFWQGVMDDFRIDDSAGLALLETAATAVDRMEAARLDIAERGELVPDRYNNLRLNPSCDLERTARAGFLSAVRALKLEIEPPRPVGRPPQKHGWKPE